MSTSRDAAKPREWDEYVNGVEAGLSQEEREILDAFRDHYAAKRDRWELRLARYTRRLGARLVGEDDDADKGVHGAGCGFPATAGSVSATPDGARLWEIVVMVGPCTEAEAAAMLDDVSEFVYGRDFDATVVMRPDEGSVT